MFAAFECKSSAGAPQVRFGEFLREHLGTWPGALVDAESGAVLGLHDGFWFFTPGQRRGIGLAGGPWCAAGTGYAPEAVLQRGHCCSAEPLLAGRSAWGCAESFMRCTFPRTAHGCCSVPWPCQLPLCLSK